jgi:hypothetical protein
VHPATEKRIIPQQNLFALAEWKAEDPDFPLYYLSPGLILA